MAKAKRDRKQEQKKNEQALEFYIQAARRAMVIANDVHNELLDGCVEGNDAVTYVDAVELAAELQCLEALLNGAISFHEYGVI